MSPALIGRFFTTETPGKAICLPVQEMQVQSLGGEDPLEEEIAPHSSILAWRIPRTEESGRLQSITSQSRTQLKCLSRQANSAQTCIVVGFAM